MTFNYDEYASATVEPGGYMSWTDHGQQVVGTVAEVRHGEDAGRNPCPELIINQDAGDPITVTAGQTVLKREIVINAPQRGDRIRITYTGDADAKPGKNPAKLFTVEVHRGAAPATGDTTLYKAGTPTQALEAAQAAPQVPADEAPF